MHLSFLKHSTNTSPHVWKERHIKNNMKQNIKNKSKLTLPLSQIHQKVVIFFQLPLNKTNRIPIDSHLNLSLPFCHVLTKTTQSEGRQKTYAIENKGKQRIKETQNNSTLQKIETTPPMNNTGYKISFSPYKNRKNKTSFGKNSFGENIGGGDK